MSKSYSKTHLNGFAVKVIHSTVVMILFGCMSGTVNLLNYQKHQQTEKEKTVATLSVHLVLVKIEVLSYLHPFITY